MFIILTHFLVCTLFAPPSLLLFTIFICFLHLFLLAIHAVQRNPRSVKGPRTYAGASSADLGEGVADNSDRCLRKRVQNLSYAH